MFAKHGQGVLQESSESMYQKFGVLVAILAGYCDSEGDPTTMLYVWNLLSSYFLTRNISYDNNQKLGRTSFKERYNMWEKDPLVEEFSRWTAESFGSSLIYYSMHTSITHSLGVQPGDGLRDGGKKEMQII